MAKGRKTIYNLIATEEAMEKVNQDNLKLLEEWEMYLRASSKSPQTIMNYISDIKIFFVFLLTYCDNKFFGDIIPRDIVKFQATCMDVWNLSGNRIRRLKDVLSSFSNYVEQFYKDDERLKDFKNITRVVPQPKREKSREETELTDADIKTIMEGLIEYEYYNAACMLALALYGGLRKGEITQIKTDTFDKERIVGNLYKTQEKIKLRGDNKNYVYFIKQEVDRFVYLWKRQRKRMFRKYGHPGPELEQYLFINYHNGKWKRYDTASMSYFSEVITKIAKESGVNKDFYWETARIFGLGKIKTAKLTEDEKKLMLQNYSIKEKARYKKL